MKNRQGIRGWLSAGKDATKGSETQIAQTKRTPTDCALIIIAQPIWNGNPTPAIRTYLNKNDLTGKKVALFFASDNLGQAVKKTKALVHNSTFVSELVVEEPLKKNKEEAKKKILEWCNTLKIA